ncbi:MAG TPA: AAA family ATPase, partial [Polyangia bacterium]|nr:AAA family ATPase [Polyangia bacterium]
STSSRDGFVRSLTLLRDRVASFDVYPFAIPAIRTLETLALHPRVTFFVGENGAGKSTLVEAIAVAAGFNAEGGGRNFNFATRRSESSLHMALRLSRNAKRERDGYFLRAESYFNVATNIEQLGIDVAAYGGKSPHEESHGESFLSLAATRLRGNGLYIFDEPEAALSPSRQLSLLQIIDRLVRQRGSQLIIATHSPILMAYPDATIYRLDGDGVAPIDYEATEHFRITRDFLASRERFFKHLFRDEE